MSRRVKLLAMLACLVSGSAASADAPDQKVDVDAVRSKGTILVAIKVSAEMRDKGWRTLFAPRVALREGSRASVVVSEGEGASDGARVPSEAREGQGAGEGAAAPKTKTDAAREGAAKPADGAVAPTSRTRPTEVAEGAVRDGIAVEVVSVRGQDQVIVMVLTYKEGAIVSASVREAKVRE